MLSLDLKPGEHLRNLQHLCTVLRSNLYQQTKGCEYNRRSNTFCAIGVAYHLLMLLQPGILTWYFANSDVSFALGPGRDQCRDYIHDYFGLTSEERTAIIYLNDAQDQTFPEIANYIEQNIIPRIKASEPVLQEA